VLAQCIECTATTGAGVLHSRSSQDNYRLMWSAVADILPPSGPFQGEGKLMADYSQGELPWAVLCEPLWGSRHMCTRR
jgi:hypothetical protein